MNWTKKRKICSDVAFLYERLSRDDDLEGESGSISNQRTLLTSFAKKNGFRNTKIFVDDGVSGVTFNRQGFKEMFKMIEFDQVAILTDRDSKNCKRYVTFWKELY